MDEGGITRSEFEGRISKCLAEMEAEKIDVLYVYGDGTRPENLVYLTNCRPVGNDKPAYSGYNAVFLLTRSGEATLVIDREWYMDWVREDSWVEDIVADSQGDTLGLSYEILKKRKLIGGKMGVEVTPMPTPFYLRFKKVFGQSKMDEACQIVSRLRQTKSKKEIELISKGLEILGKAHDAVLLLAREGIREIDLQQEARRVILDEGVEYPAAAFIDSARRSTIPLANPMATPYRLKRGDMVLVSIFCAYKKYYSGMDRCCVVGEASEKQRTLADIELKVLERAISLVKPGVKASEFMKPVYTDFAEPLLKEAGFENYNTQGYVGHGTGLMSVESPILWKLDPVVLKPGMVIDMEPGIYSKDPGIGGIRTADFVVVTETGCEVLTKYPRRIGSLA